MATILLGFDCNILLRISLFLSHIAYSEKRKFLILSLDISKEYSITIKNRIISFRTEINSISYYENMIKIKLFPIS